MPGNPLSSPASTPGPLPQRLARRIMRRAGWLALLVWLVSLGLGLVRMAEDVAEEVDAAAGLALAMSELGRLGAGVAGPADPGPEVLDALARLQHARPLRHLQLQVSDHAGRVLLPALPPARDGSGLAWLDAWPAWLSPATSAPQQVQWPLPRPDGRAWTVTLTASPEAERLEAMRSLVESLALLAAAALGLLLVMHLNLRRALAPLQRLLAAIAGIEQADTGPVRALPPMPVAELEAVAGALRHLGSALDEAESARRRLAQQVLSLQEDERGRLSRELHDEFGQRLTALRVDATWLARCLEAAQMPAAVGDVQDAQTAVPRLPASTPAASRLPEAAVLAAGMADRCGEILQDIRHLLTRLQPFGAAEAAGSDRPAEDAGAEPLRRLAGLLDGLVEAWQGRGPSIQARWSSLPGPDAPQAVPWQSLPDTHTLPRPLALALYRITQEALTNVARHAQAQRIDLSITLTSAPQPGQPPAVHWCVEDDGCGLGDPAAAARRGNGLAGLRERVWALGGELQIGPAEASDTTPGAGPGTRLQVWINRPAAAPPPPAAAPLPPHR